MTDRHTDDIRDLLARAVSDSPEPHAWADVEQRARQLDAPPPQRRRTGVWLAAAACTIALVGGLVAVVSSNDEPKVRTDDPVGTTPSTAASTSVPAPTTTAPRFEGGVVAPTGSEAMWLVPWRDGFLAIANPELWQVPTEERTLRAQFTTDGEQWTPISLGWPPELGEPYDVTTAGDRLFILGELRPGYEPDLLTNQRQQVAWTDDLTNWETLELEPPALPPDLPPTVVVDSFASSVVANDAGWIARGVGSLSVSREALLQGQDPGNSFGWSKTDDGVEVRLEDGTPYTVTWEELGIDETTRGLLGPWDPDRSVIWTDGGQVVEFGSDELDDVVAADDGFYGWGNGPLLFSADGASWAAVPAPSGDEVEFAISVAGEALAVLGPLEVLGPQWQIYAVDGPTGDWRTIDAPLPPAASGELDQEPGAPNSGAYVIKGQGGTRFVVASVDGVRWLVEELPASPRDSEVEQPQETQVALNGTTVLLLDHDTWTTFQLS